MWRENAPHHFRRLQKMVWYASYEYIHLKGHDWEVASPFAKNGLTDQCLTDNSTCFTSADFEEFMTNNGIKHITSPPYHPAMNGQAERVVQSVKESLKKTLDGDIETHIFQILLQYGTTPHTTTYNLLYCSWKENWPQDSVEFIQIYNSASMTNKW